MVSLTTNVEHTVLLPTDEYVQHITLVFSLLEAEEQVDVVVNASNEVSSWIASAVNEGSAEAPTYRVGPLSRGRNVQLSEGTWEMSILNKDGRTLNHTFEVRLPSISDTQIPFYDREVGELTVPFPTTVNLYSADNELLETLEQVTTVHLDPQVAYAHVMGGVKQVSYLYEIE